MKNVIDNATGELKKFIDEAIILNQWSKPQTINIHGMELVDLSRVIHDSFIDGWDDMDRDVDGGYDLWLKFTDQIKDGGGYVSHECCG